MGGCMDEPDGVVGGDCVKIDSCDVAVFVELSLVPARAGDPFPRLGKSDLNLHAGNDFSNRGGIGKLDAVEFLDASFGDVGVGVDEPRCRSKTVEVDDADAGSIACELQNFGIGAHFHNYAVADCNGLCYRVLRVNGEDVTVNQDEVDGRALRGKSSTR